MDMHCLQVHSKGCGQYMQVIMHADIRCLLGCVHSNQLLAVALRYLLSELLAVP